MKKKPNIIRKIFKVLLVFIVILLALMIILPFVFKGKIMDAAKKEINNNVEAKVDFEDFGLSLFTNFPNFSFHLDNISVVGIDEFEGDTLAEIKSVSVVLDLLNVISGDGYEIKQISIVKPDVSLKVLLDGQANWDIALEEETPANNQPEAEEESSDFHIALKKFEIIDANIIYDDVPGNMMAILRGLNHSLSGDFSADQTTLKTKTNIANLTLEHGGVAYLNKVLLAFDASIDADIKNEIYTFKKNELSINDLGLQFDGSIAMAGGDPNIILTFNAPKNTFKNFLSLVPAIYQKDFKDIETKGNLTFNGYVKGVYTETALPSFKLDVLVDNAEFKYPDLPSPVSDINISMNVENPGGDADNTTIDIKKFHFSMVNNPFDMSLFISTPISDPFINAGFNGRIDLSAVSKVYPLEEGETIAGIIDANINLKGKLSSIEKQAFTDFDASGSLIVKELVYAMDDENYEIANAQLNLAPAYLDLVNLDFKYGESDINLTGKIENYLAYALSDQELKGNFKAASNYFNTNQFMEEGGEEESSSSSTADSVALSVFKVPANIDFKLLTQFNKILYDNMELSDVNGLIVVRDEEIVLSNLNGKLFEGTMSVTGSYSTKDTDKPIVDFKLNVTKISFQKAFASFGILQKYAPIFQHSIGDFSSNMSFNTLLEADMNPDWMTFVGEGLMNTSSIKMDNVNTLNKLSEVLKIPSLQELDLNPVKAMFEFEEGKLILKPMDIEMEGMKANLSGWTAVDETIGYDLGMDVPRGTFGGEANNVLDGLVSQANASGANFSVGETVPLAILIGGTLSNPTVKPGLGNAGKGIIEEVTTVVTKEIDKQKEELEKEAKAEATKILNAAEQQANKVISEAQKQADQIKKTARDLAQSAKAEADSHANQLIAEGKKNGMLAEVAAKKAADEYKKTAYSQADKAVAEADTQANGIVSTARQQAAMIRSDAQKKVDAL